MAHDIPESFLQSIDQLQRGVDALLDTPPRDPLMQAGIYLAAAAILLRALARTSPLPLPPQIETLLKEIEVTVADIARTSRSRDSRESRPS